MELRVLFIQRKERYPGEYAPEALVCVDENSYDENPEWFDGEVAKELEKHQNDIAGHTIVRFNVDGEEIARRCLGQHPPIQVKMREDE